MISDSDSMVPFTSTLAVRQKREALIEEIASFLQERKAAGVVIDTTYIPSTSHRNLVTFLHELHLRLAFDNRSLILTVDMGLKSTHLQQLARTADYVITQTYDQTGEKLRSWSHCRTRLV